LAVRSRGLVGDSGRLRQVLLNLIGRYSPNSLA
jgi:hypothetical protein